MVVMSGFYAIPLWMQWEDALRGWIIDTQVALIGFGFLIVLPLSLMVAGGLIWFSRKRR